MNKISSAIFFLCLTGSASMALAQGAIAMDDMNKNTMGMEKDKDATNKYSMAGSSMKRETMDSGTMKKDSMSKNKMDRKAHPKNKHQQKMNGTTGQDSMQRMQ